MKKVTLKDLAVEHSFYGSAYDGIVDEYNSWEDFSHEWEKWGMYF